MSLVLQVPPGTQFYQPLAVFTATYNSPTVGKYDFAVAANQDVPLQPLRRNTLYIIERYSFSATIPEGDFFQAIDTTPKLSLRIPLQTNRQIYPDPIPLINYIDGLETLIFFFASQDQQLTASFSGVLDQIPSLSGIIDIDALVQLNIYEIQNKRWIDNFFSRTKYGQAADLLVPRAGRARR